MTRPRPSQLDSPLVPRLMRLVSQATVWLYKKTGGAIGGTWRVGSAFPSGVPVALLITRGRKSGQPRTTPVLYLAERERVVLVASQGGLPKHPQWYLNLQAEPLVEVQIGRRTRQMRARTATSAERAQLWPRLVELYRDFETYQSWTERVIPVVICEPN